MDSEIQEQVKQAFQRIQIITMAIGGTVMVYAIVGGVLALLWAPFEGMMPLDNPWLLRITLAIVALSLGWLIPMVRGQMRQLPPGSNPTPPDLIQRLSSAGIVTLMLSEVPAILGLVLFLLNGSPFDLVAGIAISAAYLALYGPRYGEWAQWLREQDPTRFR